MGKTADEVLGWLRKGGFPLEYRTARTLRQVGFLAKQGVSYTDPQEGDSREADVVAPLAVVDGGQRVEVTVVAECKFGTANPWVVLTTEIRPEPWDPISEGMIAATLRVDHPEILRECLPLPSPYGFSVRESFGKPGADRAYKAMNQAVSAAVGILPTLRTGRRPLVLPIVVTTEQLFRFEVDTSGAERVLSAKWERVRWHGAQALSGPTVVDIVQSESLEEYANELRGELQDLVNRFIGIEGL